MKPAKILPVIILVTILTLSSCSVFKQNHVPNIRFHEFQREIPIPEPDPEDLSRFNAEAKGDFVTIEKKSGEEFSGYVTSNREFLEEIMMPVLSKHKEKLESMYPVEQINALLLFGHGMYRTYFGKSYFSWGGDLYDLDDPQERGPNFDSRYGFDCSGFAAMPYTLAVHLGLMTPEDEGAVFSSQGFNMYCLNTGMKDKGGRDGGSNRFRVDTGDFARLGRVIFVLKKDAVPTDKQIGMLQAGDIVLLPQGHAGIIAEIDGELYYLEAGGWVVPMNNGYPCEVKKSLEIFARKGDLYIRRSLPDYGRIADN